MSVANDMSLLTLIAGASLPVQLVMVILLITFHTAAPTTAFVLLPACARERMLLWRSLRGGGSQC